MRPSEHGEEGADEFVCGIIPTVERKEQGTRRGKGGEVQLNLHS
jgi:hypothetical protein